jgi:hypothetical protein
MPDHTCPHLSPVGGWCRLKNNFKCPASVGRVGCPFPQMPNLNDRAQDRVERMARVAPPVPRHPNVVETTQIQLEGMTHPAPRALPDLEAMRMQILEREMFERAEAFKQLIEPFQADQIQWRIESRTRDGRRTLVKPFVTAQRIIERLDAMIGPSNWSDTYTPLVSADATQPGRVACRLTILGVTKEAVSAPLETSAAYLDALCKAAAKFGIGRSLERVIGAWVDWDDEYQRPLETPVLPEWAAIQPPLETIPSNDVLNRTGNRTGNRTVMPLPSQAIAETRAHDKLIADLIRAVRELPGGESELRKLMRRRQRWQAATGDDKRALYSELRRAYRQLSSTSIKAA